MSLILLAGYTGSGKTELLEHLRLKGQQVLNLEQTAAHNGSVFGHIPHGSSITAYSFHRTLLSEWQKFDLKRAVYCEAKAPALGKIQIPTWLFQQMQQAPVVWLNTLKEIRLQRLLSTYGNMEPLSFIEALSKLSKKVSKDLLEEIYANYQAGKKRIAFSMLMEYYDEAMYYNKQLYNIVYEMKITKWEIGDIALRLIEAVELLLNDTKSPSSFPVGS